MRQVWYKAILAVLVSLTAIYSQAEDAQAEAASGGGVKEQLSQKFASVRPDLVVNTATPTPMDGVYLVEFTNGSTIYASGDGRFFIPGKMFELTDSGFVDIRDRELEPQRAKLLAKLDPADMIVFSPKDQPVKAVINVFTDVDCFYCQKLHQEMADINRAGIEVRYLAFPRAGIGSDSYKKVVSAWCADDRGQALTALKNRQRIPTKLCPNNPVEAQYNLGQQMGVTGTPALVTADGKLLPGYMPVFQLAKTLGVELSPELAAELANKMAAR